MFNGWQYGGTIIDSEDLFLISLNPLFLERNVIKHSKETNNNKSVIYEPNFKYKSLEFYCYKHLGRENYAVSKEEITIEFLSAMLEECFEEMNTKMSYDL